MQRDAAEAAAAKAAAAAQQQREEAEAKFLQVKQCLSLLMDPCKSAGTNTPSTSSPDHLPHSCKVPSLNPKRRLLLPQQVRALYYIILYYIILYIVLYYILYYIAKHFSFYMKHMRALTVTLQPWLSCRKLAPVRSKQQVTAAQPTRLNP